jgi:hypothetical protein
MPPGKFFKGPELTAEAIDAQLEYVRSNPPRCLEPFDHSAVDDFEAPWDGHNQAVNPVFRLKCKCGSPTHEVHAFSWKNPDYPGTDNVTLSPVDLTCTACSKQSLLFDGERHGYSAELGLGASETTGEGERTKVECPRCGSAAMRLLVRFQLSDFVFSDEFNDYPGSRANLFGWLTLLGDCSCGDSWWTKDFDCT